MTCSMTCSMEPGLSPRLRLSARLGSKPQHCCFLSQGSAALKKSKTIEAEGTKGRGEKVGTLVRHPSPEIQKSACLL